MKTAMQEAIDKVSFVRNMCNDENNEMDLVHTLETLKKDFIKLLEKEKEQIMNAYCDGAKGGANGTKGQHENGWVSIQMRNKYYNQTYNQNK